MAVEVSILSGARQGQRLILDAIKLRAGPDPGYEIYFDPSSDSSARDRSVALTLMDDGWYIQATGQGEVFVNQNPVVGLTRIRSGSIVRMSEYGPEFEFRILARAPAPVDRLAVPVSGGSQPAPAEPAWRASPNSMAPAAALVPPVPAQDPVRPANPAPSTKDHGRLAVMIGGGVLICLVLVVLVKVMMTPSIVVVQSPEKPAADKRYEEKDEERSEKLPAAGDQPATPEVKKADPVLARLKDAVLLIQVEKGGQSWPFATCCAVSPNAVLTSAREALRLGLWMRDPASGFKGWVTNPATGLRLAVREARLYAVSVGSADKEKPNDWLYTNLGLVTVEGTLPKTAELAGPEELAKLTPGKAVETVCYVHEGDLITPEDRLEPKGAVGKILFINVHPDLPGKPRVLAVKADLPKYPLGCPLVNAEGKVVAVYSDPVAATAESKGASPGTENVHYATVVHPGVVDLWLKNADRSAWMSTAELKIPADDSAPTRPAAKGRTGEDKATAKPK